MFGLLTCGQCCQVAPDETTGEGMVKIVEVHIGPDETKDRGRDQQCVQEKEEASYQCNQVRVRQTENGPTVATTAAVLAGASTPETARFFVTAFPLA